MFLQKGRQSGFPDHEIGVEYAQFSVWHALGHVTDDSISQQAQDGRTHGTAKDARSICLFLEIGKYVVKRDLLLV